MTKKLTILLLSCGLFSCRQPVDNSAQLQSQINDLQKQLANTYRPGFGDLMSSIQIHHNKLFFAGENKNWELADFEVHEILEALEDLPKFCADREEIKSLPMIQPAIDSINNAIKQKNYTLFKSSYGLLTNTCNNCHRATNFGFNVVKIPDNPPFSNQDFKVNEPK
ncbi:MAG: hypothetical protein IPI93_04575 [Sphingobacteriaceae bacterium]|nr:hypothetical protein [Sphingobacteriaceae bacterium]MBK7310069.1 hypothetical protein [Sphingobacteriaceae bacterium]MBK7818497.1 hypothetical protein [Sphingobacteriaceae bacterium]